MSVVAGKYSPQDTAQIAQGISIIGTSATGQQLRQAGYAPPYIPDDDLQDLVDLATLPFRGDLWIPPEVADDDWDYGRWMGKRTYITPEWEYPSVSTVLSFKNQTFRKTKHLENRMLLGTYVHHRCLCDLADRSAQPHPEFEPKRRLPPYLEAEFYQCWLNWNAFCEVFNPLAEAVEQVVYSDERQYAGRADAVVRLRPAQEGRSLGESRHVKTKTTWRITEDDLWMIDLKTGTSFLRQYPAQIYAYYSAWNDLHPELPCNRMGFLQLNKNGWFLKESVGNREYFEEALAMAQDAWNRFRAPKEDEDDFLARIRKEADRVKGKSDWDEPPDPDSVTL
jgi:hypothetical protein